LQRFLHSVIPHATHVMPLAPTATHRGASVTMIDMSERQKVSVASQALLKITHMKCVRIDFKGKELDPEQTHCGMLRPKQERLHRQCSHPAPKPCLHFVHAAMSLTRRESFKPTVMHSDTWPTKSDFWDAMSTNTLQGRLGLFHHIQRTTRTLKKNHIDHFCLVTSLLNCICTCNNEDHANLLRALKEGSLSTKCTDEDVVDFEQTKTFQQRCGKCLRKEMRPTNTLCAMLDDWFDRFKCTATTDPNTRPARGRKDPVSGDTLLTPETKPTVEECKKKTRRRMAFRIAMRKEEKRKWANLPSQFRNGCRTMLEEASF